MKWVSETHTRMLINSFASLKKTEEKTFYCIDEIYSKKSLEQKQYVLPTEIFININIKT